MPVLQSPCDPDRLRLLADDLLPPEDVTRLEQHLEDCGSCRETLDRLVGDDRYLIAARRYLGADQTHDYEPAPTVSESLDFLAPSDWPDSLGRLGTYEVKGVLGRGGMGVVLKAFDPALNRNVAIKVLSASFASCGAARQRFLREARAAAAVVHEHVVAVYAVVESSGLPFLVMEYVPGKSLQDRLDRQGRLSLTEVLRIGMQTASGLAAAHAQGLVHRDVKPANILLEDGVERVRLADFGLARAAADALLTQSGIVAGTPHYMAPEQARGDLVDQRADLFSLGSTLYATCAGHPPFRAESPLAVLRRVSDDAPRSLREQNPDVPAWLEAIVVKLMAKAPAARFQTAAEVAELLEKCLAHVQQPQTAKLPNIPGFNRSAWGRWRKSRVAVGAMLGTAGVALALVIGSRTIVPTPKSGYTIMSEARTNVADDVAALSSSFAKIDKDFAEARRHSATVEASIRGGSVFEPSGANAIGREIAQAAERANALEMKVSPIPSRK
jgi:serine/threonine protein kinase